MKKILTIILLLLFVITISAQTNKGHSRKTQKTVQQTSSKKRSSQSNDGETQSSKLGKKSATNFCPDNNHPHAIDLDLPSGTLWSCCNVGASIPEEYGGLYAWGETKTKKMYSMQNYKYHDGSSSKRGYTKNFWTISGTEYDVAHVTWGNGWQMPKHTQFKELINNCIFEFITINGISGAKFIGPNGNAIFLPAAGCGFSDEVDGVNDKGCYSLGQMPSCDVGGGSIDYVLFKSNGFCEYIYYNGRRYNGFSIRPVKE